MVRSWLRSIRRRLARLVTGVDVGQEVGEIHRELAGLRRDVTQGIGELDQALSTLRTDVGSTQDQVAEQLGRLRERLSAVHEALCKTPEYLLGADGFPNPPVLLRHLVTGEYDYIPSFFDLGDLCARRIVESLKKHGVSLDDFHNVLDFGCGCGRVIRHFHRLGKDRLRGTDYNPVPINWCRQNLPFAQFDINGLEPPLHYAADLIDFAYVFSVFTHLTEPLQTAWMNELKRVLRAGGYLVISTIDENHLDFPFIDAATREKVRAGEMATVNPGSAGGNDCMAYHPFAYVRDNLARGFEILEHVPNGVGQTFYLLRKCL